MAMRGDDAVYGCFTDSDVVPDGHRPKCPSCGEKSCCCDVNESCGNGYGAGPSSEMTVYRARGMETLAAQVSISEVTELGGQLTQGDNMNH